MRQSVHGEPDNSEAQAESEASVTATAYYNEIEPYAAEWLRNLISAGLIAPGEVDTRSITDVTADDVRGFRQCHFFAGFGGWSLAIRIAGISDETPVWTGSAPCQPFSSAGKRKGAADERHLWPEFRRLIEACRPGIVFGEQVASADGRKWLGGTASETGDGVEGETRQVAHAGVRGDLEELGYSVGAADLCAPSSGEEGEGWFVYPGGDVRKERVTVGAPHIRQRLFWGAVLLAESQGTGGRSDAGAIRSGATARIRETQGENQRRTSEQARRTGDCCATSPLGLSASERDRPDEDAGSDCQREAEGRQRGAGGPGAFSGVGEPKCDACESRRIAGKPAEGDGTALTRASIEPRRPSNAGWSDFDIIPCLDGKSRRAQPGAFPLAHGVPRDVGQLLAGLERMGRGSKSARAFVRAARGNRTGRLRGYGNSIVPELAAEFIAAFMEATHGAQA